jgi:hypothetical protein
MLAGQVYPVSILRAGTQYSGSSEWMARLQLARPRAIPSPSECSPCRYAVLEVPASRWPGCSLLSHVQSLPPLSVLRAGTQCWRSWTISPRPRRSPLGYAGHLTSIVYRDPLCVDRVYRDALGVYTYLGGLSVWDACGKTHLDSRNISGVIFNKIEKRSSSVSASLNCLHPR